MWDGRSPILESRFWRPFVLNLGVVILLFGLGLLVGVVVRTQHLIDAQIEERARVYFRSIVVTRRWNAHYGGVYVEKVPGVKSNPYLVDPDIQTVDGRTFTKKNPALMTREISELADGGSLGYSFHITSLNPLNPANSPDAFEAESLRLFEAGTAETFRREDIDEQHRFRYMAPLYTEESCLSCHAEQGYAVGDVRGGVSVSFDIEDVERVHRSGTYLLVGISVVLLCLLLGLVYFFVHRLMQALNDAHKIIAEMAVTDALTGLANRRHFLDRLEQEMARCRRHGHSLGLLVLDVDHFKRINDEHGHPAGDTVLRKVARLIRSGCRETDLASRYGGEEFCVLLKEPAPDGVEEVAEKLRQSIEAGTLVADEEQSLAVTASIGGAVWRAQELTAEVTVDNLIKVVDDALYQAKRGGRNRVCMAETVPLGC